MNSSPISLCRSIVGGAVYSAAAHWKLLPYPWLSPMLLTTSFQFCHILCEWRGPNSTWYSLHWCLYIYSQISILHFFLCTFLTFVFFTTAADPWVDIFLELFTISLIFHSQVALSPSTWSLNSTLAPMRYLTFIHTSSSTSLPSCSLLDILLGLLAAALIFTTLNKTFSADLMVSLFKLYSTMGNKKMQKERWSCTSVLWPTGKYSAASSCPVPLLLC